MRAELICHTAYLSQCRNGSASPALALPRRNNRCKWSADGDKKSLSDLQTALDEIKVRISVALADS